MQVRRLRPHLVEKVWGGEKLKNYKESSELSEPLGETWEVSRIEKCASAQVEDGRTLDELYTHQQIPYLVKIIDTSDNLSVQVHPDDDYAKKHENQSGKSECWLILSSREGAGIYLGLKPGVTKEKLADSIKSGKNVNELLNFYPVARGDFFFVPAGSIHAIGAGVTLAEIQQSSGVTYRVWDWNRVGLDGKSRELHVEKAMDVINFDELANSERYFQVKRNLLDYTGDFFLASHDDFKLKLYCSEKDELVSFKVSDSSRVNSILNLEGSLEIMDSHLNPFEAAILNGTDEVSLVSAKKKGEGPSKLGFLHIY